MFYRKNLPGWERAMCVVAGLVLIVWGLLAFPAAPLGYVITNRWCHGDPHRLLWLLPDVRHGRPQTLTSSCKAPRAARRRRKLGRRVAKVSRNDLENPAR